MKLLGSLGIYIAGWLLGIISIFYSILYFLLRHFSSKHPLEDLNEGSTPRAKKHSKVFIKSLKNIGVSFTVGLLAIIVSFVPLIYLSARYFDQKYPHDGQNGLGALAVGAIGAPILGVVFGVLTSVWLIYRDRKITYIAETKTTIDNEY